MHPDLKQVFVGTFGSEIYHLQAEDGILGAEGEAAWRVTQLMSGHYAPSSKWTNEVWALVPTSSGNFISGGDDGIIREFSPADRRMLRSASMNVDAKGAALPPDPTTKELADAAKVRSLAICQESNHIAVGCKDATLRILSFETLKHVLVIKDRKKWISDLKYSPDNKFLAVGSHDSVIDLYAVDKKYRRVHSLNKHHAFITHLDWSVDSQFLHSNSGDYELLFWDASSGK